MYLLSVPAFGEWILCFRCFFSLSLSHSDKSVFPKRFFYFRFNFAFFDRNESTYFLFDFLFYLFCLVFVWDKNYVKWFFRLFLYENYAIFFWGRRIILELSVHFPFKD